MLGIMAGMAHKNSCAATQLCLAGFAGDDAARAVSLLRRQAQMLGIMAGMAQKNSYSARCRGRPRRRPLQCPVLGWF